MRRADRLFQIVQILRARRVTTARHLADELEVSERTIYRDVRDLVGSGVPIAGEAGVGYSLRRAHFDLPPLMFDATELQALALGARMVESWADPGLARAARSVLEKVEGVLPERLRDELLRTSLYAPGFNVPPGLRDDVGALRGAIDQQRKMRFAYTRADGTASTRTVRPLGLFFWGRVWTLTAWCELREGYRNFRLDRMEGLAPTGETFDAVAGPTLEDYLRRYVAR